MGIADRTYTTSQKSSRNGTTVDTLLCHWFGAASSAEAVRNMMTSGSKQVSANFIITAAGEIWEIVPLGLRAWTSGSSSDGGKGAQWDRRSVTFEMQGGPNNKPTEAAIQAAAKLYRWLNANGYNISNVLGHGDLYRLYGASYATSCPGDTVARVRAAINGLAPIATAPGTPLPVTPAPEDVIDYGYGLTRAAQKAIQEGFARMGRYSGDLDGIFGPVSVEVFQQWLKDDGELPQDYVVDGVPGPTYGRALHVVASRHGYTGTHEGLPGENVSTALINWASYLQPAVQQVRPAEPAGRDWDYWEPSGALAERVQRALKARGRYNGRVDGIFGPLTREGVQKTLAASGIFVGNIDGVIERGGCYGIQEYAKRFGDYTGRVDGAPREGSWTGFALGLERP